MMQWFGGKSDPSPHSGNPPPTAHHNTYPVVAEAFVVPDDQLRMEAAHAAPMSPAPPPQLQVYQPQQPQQLQVYQPQPPPPQYMYEPHVRDAPYAQQAPQVICQGSLGRHSVGMVCPFCDTGIRTRVRDRTDGITIIFVVILLFVFWPLFWLPFCLPRCKSTHHFCPQCHRKVGITDPCS